MDTMKSKKLVNQSADKSERGAAMIDYAILVSMVAVVSIGSLMTFSNNIQKIFCEKILQVKYIDIPVDYIIAPTWDDFSDPEDKSCQRPTGYGGDRDPPLF